MRDEILEELWQAKDEIARESDFDVVALADALRRRQAEAGRRVVDFSTRREAVANSAGHGAKR